MSDLSDWNILIVDDEPDNLGVLELVFRFYKAQVRVASSGKQCLKMLEEEAFTLLLVDIQMPEISGYELLKQVRSDARWRHIPMIAVTAHVMEGDAERILGAGFNGYIPKPINPMTIADEIKKMLEAKQNNA